MPRAQSWLRWLLISTLLSTESSFTALILHTISLSHGKHAQRTLPKFRELRLSQSALIFSSAVSIATYITFHITFLMSETFFLCMSCRLLLSNRISHCVFISPPPDAATAASRCWRRRLRARRCSGTGSRCCQQAAGRRRPGSASERPPSVPGPGALGLCQRARPGVACSGATRGPPAAGSRPAIRHRLGSPVPR